MHGTSSQTNVTVGIKRSDAQPHRRRRADLQVARDLKTNASPDATGTHGLTNGNSQIRDAHTWGEAVRQPRQLYTAAQSRSALEDIRVRDPEQRHALSTTAHTV